MVAPSAFSKDPTDQPTGDTILSSDIPKSESVFTENGRKGDSEIGTGEKLTLPNSVLAKTSRKLRLGIIMNPVVLSIINFPNKCILKKSEKYVINGMSIPPLSEKTGNNENGNHTSSSEYILPEVNSSPLKKKPAVSKYKRYAGLFLAILSSMMFSFTGLIVKILPHHHPLTQATWMFIGTVIVAIMLNLFKYACEFLRSHSHSAKDEKQQKSSETFKRVSDHVEPMKVIEGVDGSKTSEQRKDQTSVVINEKIHSGLPLPPTSAVKMILNRDPSILAKRQEAERKRKIKLFLLLVIRACSGCSGMILYFYSLKYLNVGDSLVIVCSSPIFVFIIGYLFLGESCGVIPVLTILLSMIGVAVITRPPMLTGKETFRTEDMIGAGLAFSSMLCIAITIIMMRFLQNVYHGLINLVFGVWGTIQTLSLAMALQVFEFPHNLQDAILMSTTGVLFFLGQTFLAVALQFEEAGPVSLVRTSEVVFAFLWQFIFLRVSPDLFSISGAGLILAGIFLTISRKWIASMPESSGPRKMFSFLLR